MKIIQNPAFLQAAGNGVADYFYITSRVDGNKLTFDKGVLGVFSDNVEYRVESQGNWERLSKGTVITINEGESVYFRNYTGVVNTNGGAILFDITDEFDAGGNIMRLLYPGQSAVPDYGMNELFSALPVVSAADLKLNANTVGYNAYGGMFLDCTRLITAPELPATVLAEGCYIDMFRGCTGLTTAPELPATVLAKACYINMFNGCTELIIAPVLPATVLAEGCYAMMFNGCSNLTSITCLATEISADSAVGGWLLGVADFGVFTKAADMEDWQTGANGIPAGWTVEDYVA